MKKALIGILLVILVLVVMTRLRSARNDQSQPNISDMKLGNGTQPPEATTTRKPAYNFTVSSLTGKTYRLDDFKGKILIIDFWDTWCPPCRREIPHFIDLYNEYNSKGLEIIGVAFGREGIPAVQKFIHDFEIPYINVIANDQLIRGFGPIQSIPTTLVIDQKGNIMNRYIGYNHKGVFEESINHLLANPPK